MCGQWPHHLGHPRSCALPTRHTYRTPELLTMSTDRIIVGVLVLLATIWHAIALRRAEVRLEGLRRIDAPPAPGYALARLRYFSDPLHLQPDAGVATRRYRRLWFGQFWIPLGWLVVIPWLLG